jgi:hypothetical protein
MDKLTEKEFFEIVKNGHTVYLNGKMQSPSCSKIDCSRCPIQTECDGDIDRLPLDPVEIFLKHKLEEFQERQAKLDFLEGL